MNIELVVFDMAGTTVNDEDGVNRAVREALAAAGITVSRDAVNAVMGIPKPVALQRLIEQSPRPELLKNLAAIHDDFVVRMTRFYETDPSVHEIAGAGDVFRRLRGGRQGGPRYRFQPRYRRRRARAARLAQRPSGRRHRDQRRSRARATATRHDPARHAPVGRRRGAPRGQGRRYAGRPRRGDARRLRTSDRRHRGFAHSRPAPPLRPHPPRRQHQRSAGDSGHRVSGFSPRLARSTPPRIVCLPVCLRMCLPVRLPVRLACAYRVPTVCHWLRQCLYVIGGSHWRSQWHTLGTPTGTLAEPAAHGGNAVASAWPVSHDHQPAECVPTTRSSVAR